MKIFNSLYVKKEVQKIYAGIIEGQSCVKLWWNGGIDSSLEKTIETEVITVGVRDEKRQDIDYYYYIVIDGQEIEINTENQEILYSLLTRKEVV